MRYSTGEEEYDFMSRITYHNYQIIELYYQLSDDLTNGNEDRALHIVFEFADTRYVKYAFKLLKRYAAKEIGVSDPLAFVIVKTIAEAWEKDKASKARGGESDRHYLALAVQYLARAKKGSATRDYVERVNQERYNRQFFLIDESNKQKAKEYQLKRRARNEREPSNN